MPQLGLEVNEGTVITVLVEIGNEVRRDQPLIELETDKAITEVVAPRDGIVRTIEAEPGQTVPVGAVLIRLAETTTEPMSEDRAPAADGPTKQAAGVDRAEAVSATAADHPTRLRVAPVARRAAVELGIDLRTITGTGPGGRITLRDVQTVAANGDAAPGPDRPGAPARPAAAPSQLVAAASRTELTPTRRAIARRMTVSQSIPQYHLVREVDASHLIAEKAAQSSRGPSNVGINDLLVQAIAEAAVDHPALATSYVGAAEGEPPYLRTSQEIDVGLAVATERGLVVPVIRGAQAGGLRAIADERRRLVDLARSGRIGLGEITGATITLSSLAAAGIDRFTAMVNPGEAAIVAVGTTVDRLVPRGRTISVVPTLTVTITFDHRVVDGAVGAQALSGLAELLEGAMRWRP
jgi:pyruvate dehydrogenase E2 component (dihydrolipoamide acetyltransferase)